MKRMLYIAALALLTGAGLFGFGTYAEAASTQSPVRQAASLPASMLGVTWDLIGIQSSALNVEDTGDKEMTIIFDSDGRVSGMGGCNSFSGTYQVGPDGALTISGLISTLKFCAEPGVADLEALYFAALSSVNSYVLNGPADMQLNYNNGASALIYRHPLAGGVLPGGMPTTGSAPNLLFPVLLAMSLFALAGGLLIKKPQRR